MNETHQFLIQVDELLSLPEQIWLLGAGISKDAGIPLMGELTDRVESVLGDGSEADFKAIRAELPDDSHVEHVLSHISDLISIAARTNSQEVLTSEGKRQITELIALHSRIRERIRETVRFGYIPASDESSEQIGTLEKPIVRIEHHVDFIEAIFRGRRAGLERRPPIAFFTTNYDTLLEDSLAFGRIATSDGFTGGTMAFWDPGAIFDIPLTQEGQYQAIIHKLHGSIDWFLSPEDIVVRRREGAGYPPEESQRLLIYPQANKYQVAQKDPFASLFSAFRRALSECESGVFCVCGYSFRDDHVNEEIERALRQRDSSLTLLAFVKQIDDDLEGLNKGLPAIFSRWMGEDSGVWRERIIVAGSRGLYHGSLENIFPAQPESPHDWWSFQGLTKFLKFGPGAGK